jgi:cytochrome d ubiquinol oxidase subunit I
MGVVTGIVMEFEFGTNWAVYSRYVGDVFGSALAAEGIFAFFLESGFLALLIFGWDRVGPRMHFFSTIMVALGSIFSSIWITVANSWQQTPAGHELREHVVNQRVFQRAEIVDFWAMVLNPSSLHRLIHVWLGALVLGAFFVLSISAWYLLRNKHLEFARRSLSGALLLATVASLAQFVSGDVTAKNVARHQPAKLAAMEGLFHSQSAAPLTLFGWPDEQQQRVQASVAIPGLLSWLLYGDSTRPVAGLDELQPQWGTPPVWLTFQAYHLMVGIGTLFIISTLYASFLRLRGRLFEKRWLLWYFVVAVVLAFVANELGWVTAEVGRQPWIVCPTIVKGQPVGGLRTSDALSEAVGAEQVLASILMFGAIYAVLFVLWIIVLNHKIQQGPEPAGGGHRSSDANLLDTVAERTGHHGSLTEAKA